MSDYSNEDAMSEIKESLSESARTLASDAENLLHKTASMTGEGIAALREKLSESLRSVREQATQVQDYALERGKQAFTGTDTYVRERPWQAVGIAALAGLLIGFIASGSRRS